MKTGILIAFGELFLKSERVQKIFKNKLKNTLSFFLHKEKIKFSLVLLRDRIFVATDDSDKALEIGKNVFGISWLAKVYFFENFANLLDFIESNYQNWLKEDESFRINFSKSDSLKKSSPEIIAEVAEKIKRKVNLTNPDKEIFLEYRKIGWFLFFAKEKGPGGLPVGVEGKVLALISGGIDSPVASYLIAKRGAENVWLHFHSYPLASQASIEKVKKLAEIFIKYQPKLKIFFVPFADIQKKIIIQTLPKDRVLLYRRSMLRIAEKLAQKEKCLALATGESLGQVSSQSLTNIGIIEEATLLPILRPLAGLDKNEIIDLAKKIGTYEISIQPQDDCCSLFVPRHVTASGSLTRVKQAENKLEIEKLEDEAIYQAEIIIIK